MYKKLAIIGAGPEGAAIAAKAAALHAANHLRPPPHIDLYDPNPVGAAWRGSIGYTDGVQPLCTVAERYLGFPYDSTSYGTGVAQAMMGEFLWQSFAITASGPSRYREWVVNGRHPPRHLNFADYLDVAVSRSVHHGAARLVPNTVTSVDFVSAGGAWRLESVDSDGTFMSADYDGVVVTGNGRPQLASLAPTDGCSTVARSGSRHRLG